MDEVDEDVTLDERPEVVEEIGPEPIETNWQCGECGKLFENSGNLDIHIQEMHTEPPSNKERIVYLIPEVCTPCVIKDKKLSEYEKNEPHVKSTERELDILRRRHDQLKQKHEDAIKTNKEYSKNLLKTIKENTELKASAEKDAEVLMDTLSINQVLMEEVKVKDAIIKADELLRDSQSTSKKTEDDTDTEVHIQNRRNIIRCNKCEWTSPNQAQLPGHMLKHEGQYICPKCKLGYKTKKEMNEHMQAQHKVQQESVNLTCITCDKTFPSQHSLKQHLNSKHKKEEELPVGHPQRAQNKNNESP